MPGADAAPGRGPAIRLLGSLRRLIAGALAMARTRLELLGVELQLEVQRAIAVAVWALVATLAGGITLFLAGLTVIIAFWDEHRLVAAVGVTAAFFVFAVVAMAVLLRRLRAWPPMFQATLAELARDRERLGGGS